MATTAVSSYATDSIILEGKDRAKKIAGKVAGAYTPGQIVYQSGAGPTWTTTPGSAGQYKRVGWVEFKMRTSSTFGEVDIDTAYTTDDNLEIIVGPRDGTIKLCSKCVNPAATKYYGEEFYASSGGALKLSSSMTSATVQAILAEEGCVTGDTVIKVYIV